MQQLFGLPCVFRAGEITAHSIALNSADVTDLELWGLSGAWFRFSATYGPISVTEWE